MVARCADEALTPESVIAARERDAARIVVVGAGAGGVEVAFALAARLRGERAGGVEVVLLDDPTCFQLMSDFIEVNPELWNEDIGVD